MLVSLEITREDVAAFARDGFLIRDRIIDKTTVDRLRDAMERSFQGECETGLMPDEVNWKPGDDPHVTRQICNVWKSNRTLASIILSEAIGRATATLNGWPGARIAQDNLLHKPPASGGTPGGSLGMHQDSAYAGWAAPRLMCTVWIALDDVTRTGGTMEFARGSHLWGASSPIEAFHNPEDYQSDFRRAACAANVPYPDMVAVEVPAGGGSIHHGWLWHGSGPNATRNPRRSVVRHSPAKRDSPATLDMSIRGTSGSEPTLWIPRSFRSSGAMGKVALSSLTPTRVRTSPGMPLE
ncbi:MAG: phytanoyl-CoA dioxygenase family protein [Pseudomonadota bacterium]